MSCYVLLDQSSKSITSYFLKLTLLLQFTHLKINHPQGGTAVLQISSIGIEESDTVSLDMHDQKAPLDMRTHALYDFSYLHVLGLCSLGDTLFHFQATERTSRGNRRYGWQASVMTLDDREQRNDIYIMRYIMTL